MTIELANTGTIVFVTLALLVAFVVAVAQRVRATQVSPEQCAHDKLIVVTGAASGLGRATILRLLEIGKCTIVAFDLSRSGLDSLSHECAKLGASEKVHTVECDVSDSSAVARALESAEADVPHFFARGIHALVPFAGVVRAGPVGEMAPRDMKLCLDVNVLGTFNVVNRCFEQLCRAAAYHLARDPQECTPKPRVIFIASEVALSPAMPCVTPYQVSKVAIKVLADAFRREVAGLGMLVSTVYPGSHRTPLLTVEHFSAYARPHHLYRATMEYLIAEATNTFETARPASDVADCVAELCARAVDPPAQVHVNVATRMWLTNWLPKSVLDFALRAAVPFPTNPALFVR